MYDHKSCDHLRDYKVYIWEGGHHEPFIAKWPSIIKPRTTTNQLICLTDLMAACTAIIGANLPENAVEVVTIFYRLQQTKIITRQYAQPIIHHSVFSVFSLRHQEWKLILVTQGSGVWPPSQDDAPNPDSPEQLYHLLNDLAKRRI